MGYVVSGDDEWGDDLVIEVPLPIEPDEPVVDPALRYAAPDLAIGHDVGQAAVRGSAAAQHKARLIALSVIIILIVLPMMLLLIAQLL